MRKREKQTGICRVETLIGWGRRDLVVEMRKCLLSQTEINA